MLCKFIAVLAVACISSSIISATTDKVVCYHGTWAKYRNGNGKFLLSHIDPTLCTHIIYSFVGISSNGQVTSLDSELDYGSGNLNKFTALKSANPKLKTLLAIGGWGEGSTKYSAVAASAELRAVFIKSALDIVLTHGFDGFDLDWEYPAQRGGSAADVANYATLIKEFRETFDKHGLLLSAAVAAPLGLVEISYDVPSLSKYLDFINIMAYDLHASWDNVLGHNAPLYASSVDTTAPSKLLNLKSIVESWIAKGADPQKLVLGIPFYGRTFTLASTTNVAIGAASRGAGTAGPYTSEAGMLGYNEIVEKQLAGGWTTVWDDEQKVPHMYKGDQWVCYDDPQSVTLKVEYAKSMSLAGVMIWSIETDDFRGASGTAYPLLSAINVALTNSNSGEASRPNSSGAAADATNNISSSDNSNSPNSISINSDASPSQSIKSDASSSSNDIVNNVAGSGSADAPADASVPCTEPGYYRDSKNCNKFYHCYNDGSTLVAQINTCSAGLYFDDTAKACNWASLVVC